MDAIVIAEFHCYKIYKQVEIGDRVYYYYF